MWWSQSLIQAVWLQSWALKYHSTSPHVCPRTHMHTHTLPKPHTTHMYHTSSMLILGADHSQHTRISPTVTHHTHTHPAPQAQVPHKSHTPHTHHMPHTHTLYTHAPTPHTPCIVGTYRGNVPHHTHIHPSTHIYTSHKHTTHHIYTHTTHMPPLCIHAYHTYIHLTHTHTTHTCSYIYSLSFPKLSQ